MILGRALSLTVSALILAGCATPAPVVVAPPLPPPVEVPTTSAGAFLAGRDAQGRHDLKSASFYLGQALAIDSDNVEILHRAAIAFALEGQIAEAARLASRLEAFDDEATVPAMLLIEQHAKAGDWDAVVKVLDRMPAGGLNLYLLPLCRAWAEMGLGHPDQALSALASLQKIQGLALLHDFNAGLINDLADRAEPAEQAYRATLTANSGRTLRTIEIISSFYQRLGRDDEAKRLLDQFRAEHPDMPDLIPVAGRPVKDAVDGLAEALFGSSLTMRQANLPELGLLFTQLALDLRPDFPLAQVMAGDILSNLGRLSAANDFYFRIGAGSPLYRSTQMRIARNLEDLDRVDEAAALLRHLIQAKPQSVEAVLALGDLWRRQRRWLDAIDAYDQALPLLQGDPRSEWPVYYARGVALERANLWPRAEADLLKALQLQPDQPEVLNYLGYSWIEQGTNLSRATAMIEHAVALRPQDGFIIDSLGWAFYRSGDYDRAVETLQRAVAIEPGDAAINDHLGDALWSAGRAEEARFQWRHALQSDPEAELRARIEGKLKQAAIAPSTKDKP